MTADLNSCDSMPHLTCNLRRIWPKPESRSSILGMLRIGIFCVCHRLWCIIMCLASLLPNAMDALWHNMVVEEIAMLHINVTITYLSHAGIQRPGTFQLSSRSLKFQQQTSKLYRSTGTGEPLKPFQTISTGTFWWELQGIQLGWASVRDGLGSITQKLLQIFEACHSWCAFVLYLGLLVLFKQIAPLICAHCRRAVIAALLHFMRNLLPQMLVALGCVEHIVHLLSICNQCFYLVLHPCFGPLLGSLDLYILTRSICKKHLVHSCQLMGDRKLLWWWCHSVHHYIHLLNTLFESV